MDNVSKAFGALIAAARNWAASRARLRRLADSKRATPSAIKKAQRQNVAADGRADGQGQK